MTFIIIIHIIVCIGLVALVLIQRGRGGGLVESFSGVESMFGTKTSALLTRLTTILAVLFFISCLSLAFLSVRQSRSLMKNIKPQEQPPVQESGQQKIPETPQPAAEEPLAKEEPPGPPQQPQQTDKGAEN